MHVVLLVNALLLVAALVGQALVPGDAGWSLAACAVGTAAVALLGVPASVLCSWQRAFLPIGHRGRNVVVALSHAVSIWFAVLLLAPTFESFRTALLGSLTT